MRQNLADLNGSSDHLNHGSLMALSQWWGHSMQEWSSTIMTAYIWLFSTWCEELIFQCWRLIEPRTFTLSYILSSVYFLFWDKLPLHHQVAQGGLWICNPPSPASQNVEIPGLFHHVRVRKWIFNFILVNSHTKLNLSSPMDTILDSPALTTNRTQNPHGDKYLIW